MLAFSAQETMYVQYSLPAHIASVAEQTNWSLEKESIPSAKVTLILNKCAMTNLSELMKAIRPESRLLVTSLGLTWFFRGKSAARRCPNCSQIRLNFSPVDK